MPRTSPRKASRFSWLRQILRTFLLLWWLCAASLAGAQEPPLQIKVMPLGDSLTAGYPLRPERSYRLKLLTDLLAVGKKIDYVGAGHDPDDPPNYLAHQGAVGATVDNITGTAAWNTYKPAIILLMAGTNDFRQVDISRGGLGGLGMVALGGALATLINKINKDYQDRGQKVEIFISSIPPIGYPREGTGPTVTRTLLDYLKSQGLSFEIVGGQSGAVDQAKFTSAVTAFIGRRKLNPDPGSIFKAADADGDGSLTATEYEVALRLLGEFIVNKYINDYNNEVRILATEHSNTHFVDAGSQLTLADFTDGTHPATQEGYDKLAPAWFASLQAFFASNTHYWINGSGFWEDSINWSDTPDGPGGAGQPTGGTVYLLQHDDIDRTVTRDSAAAPAQLLDLRIDASGTGNITLRAHADLEAMLTAVGIAGKGRLEQTGGTMVAPTLLLGAREGSSGAYVLDGVYSTLRAETEDIGFNGSGSFTQDNGSNDVLRRLTLGYSAGGFGGYTLNQGVLTSNEEVVGMDGTGVFIQNGGTHRIEAKVPIASGMEGTLSIGAGHSSYTLARGALSANFIINNGTFDYTGGTLEAWFGNSGVLRLRGVRQIIGNFSLSMFGQIQVPDAFTSGTPTRLEVANGAELEGKIYVTLAPGVTLRPGDSTEILRAGGGISPVPGVLRLPLLPGKLILRGELVEQNHALRITVGEVNCADVELVRRMLGQRGPLLDGDVNDDGVVDVRDLAMIAHKLPAGATCPF
ncbi:SGNH/GDSL hydrolase family protein [Janthinobacterium sp.]|uniref:SGNH/GDSL hydrolase family protein n=1 Tax=Janthinobacterium sp. TaxID=1871054 RepID=UPI002DBB9007|nr:SGNH/GDSL hydrolase family protein [Janthinobacterium sp.]HEU4819122.1 SGNH/GDSL hydrolase family protein [Janthinobacterium sp.]